MKRQPTDRKKIFANDVTDKGVVFKIYKQLVTHNKHQNKQPTQKMDRRAK